VITHDKESWGDGPWIDEPDRMVWFDEDTGYPCAIVRGPGGHLCGYVGVPPGHPAYRAGYDDVPVDVHGGLTYGREGSEDVPGSDVETDAYWFGFDCAHLDDMAPAYRKAMPGMWQGTYRNLSYVKSEVRSLAAQLREMHK
jgi:hypothetical protein